MPRVKHEILRWAREQAGLSREEAAARLGLEEAYGVAGEHRLEALEKGFDQPSRAMLVHMASVYRRPLVTFYLAEPPRTVSRGSDFRTLPEDYARRDEALIDALLREVRARQAMVRSILEDEEDVQVRKFVGSVRPEDGVPKIAETIRTHLGFSLAAFRKQRSHAAAFKYARAKAEAAGVFVILLGDLGSYHTALDVEIFRGFAIADPLAPFAVVNDRDSYAAWTFTLMHELTHLWLGQTGVSGAVASKEIERFCNDVASELLLGTEELSDLTFVAAAENPTLLRRAVAGFARTRNLSGSMVAYRLHREGLISRGAWIALHEHFRSRWLAQRARRRKEEGGGGSFFTTRRHRLGDAMLSFAARALGEGALSTAKAAFVLGVRPKQVGPLLREWRPA